MNAENADQKILEEDFLIRVFRVCLREII